MVFTKVVFAVSGAEQSDMLLARLLTLGFDGFEESDGQLLAYIESAQFDESVISSLAAELGVSFETEAIPSQNWNEVWESNFSPVVVEGFCTIRADFHDIKVETPYEIVITPKMSFGTGHHATTQLMLLMMKDLKMNGLSVLDFGTGTGVLAIMAEKLGACPIMAIDNDDWCVENASENIIRNNCKQIIVKKGSLEIADNYNVILANINRHILLQYMPMLSAKLAGGGLIIMSGLLIEDREIITTSAESNGFRSTEYMEQNGWIALEFIKL
jgi:ribosomal protein L11 methyltransferase